MGEKYSTAQPSLFSRLIFSEYVKQKALSAATAIFGELSVHILCSFCSVNSGKHLSETSIILSRRICSSASLPSSAVFSLRSAISAAVTSPSLRLSILGLFGGIQPKYSVPISVQSRSAIGTSLAGSLLKIKPAILLGALYVRKPFITAPMDSPEPLQSRTITEAVSVMAATE